MCPKPEDPTKLWRVGLGLRAAINNGHVRVLGKWVFAYIMVFEDIILGYPLGRSFTLMGVSVFGPLCLIWVSILDISG